MIAILVLAAVLVIAVYLQAFVERCRLRRAALSRPAIYVPTAHENHALAQTAYRMNPTLPNYHALRATEDALERGSQELNRATP